MSITVSRLHKILGKLIQDGHARKRVVVDKESFTHACESDGVTILPLCGVGIEMIINADDDGGAKVNKDGSESYSTSCVLVGDTRADGSGNIVKRSANSWS